MLNELSLLQTVVQPTLIPRWPTVGRVVYTVVRLITFDSLRDPELSLNTFKRQLKTYMVHFYQILTTKRTKRIRDSFEYAPYKFTLYLLTHYPTTDSVVDVGSTSARVE